MSPKIIFKGVASQKILASLELASVDQHASILDLATQLGIPIASSCGGEGVCRKCVVNKNLLSCQQTVVSMRDAATIESNGDIEISIDYL